MGYSLPSNSTSVMSPPSRFGRVLAPFDRAIAPAEGSRGHHIRLNEGERLTMSIRNAVIGLLLIFLSAGAYADPITNCVNKITPAGGISCDVYRVTSTGTFSQISDVFDLPTFVTAGYLVITSDPSNASNRNLWLDVVSFIDNGPGKNSSIQLFAAGCNGAGIACFPTYFEVVDAATYVFLDLTGYPKVYNAGDNTYNIFDDSSPVLAINPADTAVPEPTSVVLLASGLLVAVRRRRGNCPG